jgi:multidrug efflux pump subunit AcrB
MTNSAEWALEHPHVVWLATLMALCYGALSYVDLPRQENPSLVDRRAIVTTYLPGAEPERVELLIAKVLEDAISEVDDIDSIFTESIEGMSHLLVELDEGAPSAERLDQIRRKVREAQSSLPPTASEPEVDTRILRTNTMILAVTSRTVSPLALREHAKELKRELEYLSDIGRVQILGEANEEIEVAVDALELAQRSLPLTSVIEALADRNTLEPSGQIELDTMRSAIQTTSSYENVGQVQQTFLSASDNGLPVSIDQVAKVTRKLEDQKVFVRFNGAPAVSVALEMLPRRNAIAVGEQIRTLIDNFAPRLSEGVSIEIIADEPRYVGDRLGTLTDSLNLGLMLVLLFTLIGLGWRSGIIIAVSIPLSITVALGFISMAGVELHQISIAALVIAVGLVVDEDIVVVDNIQRHLDMGKSAAQAAIVGLGEIHMAILSGAGTTIAAFIPLALMSGQMGEFVRTIPIAVSVMLITSVVVAHFFTPLLSATLHRFNFGGAAARRKEQHRFEAPYRVMLGKLLNRQPAVLAGFVLIFVLSVFGVGSSLWPPDFFNDADRHQFLLEAYLPMGTPVGLTDIAARKIEQTLAADDRVESWGAFVGSGVPKFYYNQFTDRRGENLSMFVVNTKDFIPFSETRTVAEDIDAKLDAELPGVFVRAKVLKQGYGERDAVRIFVQGESMPILRSLANRVREIVAKVPGTTNIRDNFGYDSLSIKADIHHAKANLLGVSTRDITTTLRTAIDGVTATTFREDDEEIAIRVRLDSEQRNDVNDLDDVLIYSTVANTNVPVAQVASIVPGFATREILRFRRKREAAVLADITADRTLMAVTQDVEKAVLKQVTVPPGYEISFHGQHEEVTRSLGSLARAAVVAVFLIYILLVVQFKSLTQPGLIMLAIPMALIGAIWGLKIMGQEAGFMAFLGMISLIGIVVNDSIVLLDYINRKRREGKSLEDAVIQGASSRLRAIVLTSVTTIGGLIPLSLSGGTLFAPFGWAMIFGLAGSSVMTLVVQPVAYMALESRRTREYTGDSSFTDEVAA